MVSLSVDKDSGSMYVKLRKDKIIKTLSLGKDRFIDINEKGKIVGIEVLMPSKLSEEVNEVLSRSADIIEIVQ